MNTLFYFALIYFREVFRRKPHTSYPIPETYSSIVRIGGSLKSKSVYKTSNGAQSEIRTHTPLQAPDS